MVGVPGQHRHCGYAAIIGAIMGHVARRQIRERGEEGDGMALTGVIVGWIVFSLAILGTLALPDLLRLGWCNTATTTRTRTRTPRTSCTCSGSRRVGLEARRAG
jgi:hypothetical protein